MGTFPVGKRVRGAEEYPLFEDHWLFDDNYEKLLRSLQLSDENLDNISVDQGGSLLYVDPRIKHHRPETSRKSRATGRTNLRKGMTRKQRNEHKDSAVHSSTNDTEGPKDVKHALKKKRATMEEEDHREKKSSAVMKNVKSEPVDFDSCGMNECSNKRTRLEASNTSIPLKSVVAMENVKVEAPDSDCGGNRRMSERCRKRPGLEVSNTPKKLKKSLVKKKNEINRTSRRFLKKQRVKMSRRNKSARLFPSKKSETKKKVNVKGCRLNSERKGSQVLLSAQSTRSCKALSSHMDETYEAFLDVALMSGDHMIYTPRNGTSYIYEEDMQSAPGQTVVGTNRPDGYRPSNAATNGTLRNGVIKEKMSYPKHFQDTSAGSDINELDNHQRDDYHASHVSEYEVFIPFLEVDGKNLIYAPRNGGRKIYEEVETTSDAEANAIHRDPLDSSCKASEYEVFIPFLEVDGKNLIYAPRNGGQKIYEEVETTSDAETNAIHRDPLDSSCKMDTDSGRGIESHNQFMEELMKDLKRPYNEEEYLKLLEEASNRGPSDHETDLSNGMESSQIPREYGQSYIQVYRDLNAKINAANGDRSRILNLLRGLFYWLKNMSKEGSFIPWKNKRCLKALPQPEGHPSYK